MNDTPKIYQYKTLDKLVTRIRDDLNNLNIVLLYGYNGIGKTRLSMAFKDWAKNKSGGRDTLYFNAFTEDLFYWNNDLTNESERFLQINADSSFFSGFKELVLEEKIYGYIQRYADFEFKIDYEKWTITFSRGEEQNIKVSRGEENIFIWCIFLAICDLVIDDHVSYAWVKILYIDDPISSLDDNNAIAVASDLAQLLKRAIPKLGIVISSHHGLFFNVMWNELKSSKIKHQSYFYNRPAKADIYTLCKTGETPFFQHVSMLTELQQAAKSGKLYTHHFNALRSIMEKTAIFFGFKDFSACIHGVDDEILFARALNLLSHGKYSVFSPMEMGEDNKELFNRILNAFLERYEFELPKLKTEITEQKKVS